MPSLELVVIDSAGGSASYHAQQTYHDQLPIMANSVWTMVDGILARLALAAHDSADDPAGIGLLRIIGHGSPGRQGMGDSRITTNPRQLIMLDRYGHLLNQPALARLRGHFLPGAVVELHGCNVGAGPAGANLLRALERFWGVRVRAGAVEQDAGTRGFEHFAPVRSQR